jgi:hypothetical protein
MGLAAHDGANPLYWAVMVSTPAGSEPVVKLAVAVLPAAATLAEPIGFPSVKKFTVPPFGVPLVEATTAVNATGCP